MKLRKLLGIESMLDVVRRGRLKLFGHVERKPEGVWVKEAKARVMGREGGVALERHGGSV